MLLVHHVGDRQINAMHKTLLVLAVITVLIIRTDNLREFSSNDATGVLHSNLKKIFYALKAIPPTSVEAERAFSAAGLFLTKLRSKLDDGSIDMLCFLCQNL